MSVLISSILSQKIRNNFVKQDIRRTKAIYLKENIVE